MQQLIRHTIKRFSHVYVQYYFSFFIYLIVLINDIALHYCSLFGCFCTLRRRLLVCFLVILQWQSRFENPHEDVQNDSVNDGGESETDDSKDHVDFHAKTEQTDRLCTEF